MKFWPKMSPLSLYSSILKSKEILEVLPEELVKETEKSCRKRSVCRRFTSFNLHTSPHNRY